jgi:apolipoprotein N-acyltransferase
VLAGEFSFWLQRRSTLSVCCLMGAAGGLCPLALSPLHLFPVLLLSFTFLVSAVAMARGWGSAFAFGWVFGVGYFVGGLYWIEHAFVVAELGVLLGCFAVLLMSVTLGLVVAAVAVLTKLTGFVGVRQSVAFACFWTLGEWIRSFSVLGGFPWNLVGYAWAFSDEIIQLASLLGVFGLSALTVFVAALPGGLMGAETSKSKFYVWGAVTVICFGLVWAFGFNRLGSAPTRMVDDVMLRLVQANLLQIRKRSTDLWEENLLAHVELTGVVGDMPVTHVVWPETAVPYPLAQMPSVRKLLADALPEGGLLLTGALRIEAGKENGQKIWNGLSVITSAGDIVGSYDKRKLVPFGEYVPFRKWFSFNRIVSGPRDFSAGTGPQNIEVPSLPLFRPLICYEVIFPGSIIGGGERPEWLLNLTNDAWYGHTSGPYQHFTQARLRAVEEGLPLVRSANTGISAVVDSYGRTVAMLALGERGVLDSGLPVAIPEGTFYSRFGNIPVLLISLFLLAGLLMTKDRGMRPRPHGH